MVKVYIAAPFQLKPQAVELMHVLREKGHSVTSTWLRVEDMPDTDAAARLDLRDVLDSDVLLALNPEGWEKQGTGGRHVELGYALALDIPIVLFGVRSNVFHFHSDIEHVETRDAVLAALERLNARLVAARKC